MIGENGEGGGKEEGEMWALDQIDIPNVEEGHKYKTQSSVLFGTIQHVSEFSGVGFVTGFWPIIEGNQIDKKH